MIAITRSATTHDVGIPRADRHRLAFVGSDRALARTDLGLAHRGSVDSGDAHRDRPADHRGRRRLTPPPDRPRRPGRRRPRDRRRSGGPRPGPLGARRPRRSGSTPTPRRWPSSSAPRRREGRATERAVRRRRRGARPRRAVRVADELTILFPWGSLLRGVLALDDAAPASAGIASLLAPGGVVDRDRLDRGPRRPRPSAARRRGRVRGAGQRWSRYGLELCSRPAGHGGRDRSDRLDLGPPPARWSRACRLAPRAAAAIGPVDRRCEQGVAPVRRTVQTSPEAPCRAPGHALVARLVRQADQRSADGRRRASIRGSGDVGPPRGPPGGRKADCDALGAPPLVGPPRGPRSGTRRSDRALADGVGRRG